MKCSYSASNQFCITAYSTYIHVFCLGTSNNNSCSAQPEQHSHMQGSCCPGCALQLLHIHVLFICLYMRVLHMYIYVYVIPNVLRESITRVSYDVCCQVECELHSRLGRTEEENRRCAGQLAALESALREERHAHSRDKEALMLA